MTVVVNGNEIREKIKAEIKQEIDTLVAKKFARPCLVVVQVGDDPASSVYVKNKQTACKDCGITSKLIKLDKNITQKQLTSQLDKLSKSKKVHGILLQLPLPYELNSTEALTHIAPIKDVDGLTTTSLGKLISDADGLFPCTPSGVIEILKTHNVELKGKVAVVINRSLLVGKPMAQLLIKNNATVIHCHSHTVDLKKHTLNADIVITAVGKRNFITKDMIKKGAAVIDVSIVREGNKLYGDCDYEEVKKVAGLITPVPGGVGPLTIALLLKNTLKAYKMQNKIEEK